MIFKQFHLNCLAHYSYIIGSNGEACVIDPSRDIELYEEFLKEHNLKLKFIIETHLHADFVSGHNELKIKTGANIVYGRQAVVDFPHLGLSDNDNLKVGSLKLTILETPGHTPESISILVTDTSNPSEPAKLFTGDTLFIGDVGRPDLVVSKGFTIEQMAGLLYDSISAKILTLDDNTQLYPAHGMGSLCGKNISKENTATLESQKQSNNLLKLDKADFINAVSTNLPPVPAYFLQAVNINAKGAKQLHKINKPKQVEIDDLIDFDKMAKTVLDVRNNSDFARGHIEGAINISLNGQFASWAGSILNLSKPLVLIIPGLDKLIESVIRLARIGFDQVIEYCIIDESNSNNPNLIKIAQVSVEELNHLLINNPINILDVRTVHEVNQIKIDNIINIPLMELPIRVTEIAQFDKLYVICGSGYRSSIACSFIANQCDLELINVIGGMQAYKEFKNKHLANV